LQTDEIRHLQTERDRLRREVQKDGSTETWILFRAIRNKIKTVIGKARRSFLAKALSSKRPKQVWKIIHRILHPNPNPLHEDPEKLNKYFISTATRTLGTEPDDVQDLLNLVQSLPEQTEHSASFTLKNVHQFEIVKEISRLRSDTSTGFDQIPVKFIKLVSTDLVGPLTYIINTCIDSSLFPRTWKTARVSPIPKINNPTCEKDYRPISILPALSKIFERLVNNQIVTYIDEQGLLASGISGYRRGHSTTTVLLRIRDNVIKAMKRGEVTMMVCADYSKAFDTVQFKAVLMKMHGMGFSKKFPSMGIELSLRATTICSNRRCIF
jgi:hypothetical protein